MKEVLQLPGGCLGAAWRYAPHAVARHRHAELEANLVLRGSARYLVADRRYDLGPGGLVWLFPEQEHVLLDMSPDFAMWIGVWRPALIRSAATLPTSRVLRQRSPEGSFYRTVGPAELRSLVATFERISRLQGQAEEADRANALLAVLLLDAWAAFCAADQPAARHVHPAVEQAVRLVRQGGETMSLPQLAGAVGLSPPRLSRLFRQQTGVPLVRFRQKQLIERFFQIYGDGSRFTLMDAALRAGFGSYPQFHRVFRAIAGRSPAGYFRGASL